MNFPPGNDKTIDTEKTRPPAGNTRFDTPADLYAAIPQIAELTQQRPTLGEDAFSYLIRLRSGTTPEEAVTFPAFALAPQTAIWWGHECLRTMPDYLNGADRDMMEGVMHWVKDPSTYNRHYLMREALWAPTRSPAVLLALAVGWSGGSIAPNDPAPVPLHRAPRSINSSILSCLARADLSRRSVFLARFIDMAEALVRVY
ncbi:MAG: DUF6931 family protein [Paracoccaceae bacterium]